MTGDVAVNNAPSVMVNGEKAVEHAERNSGQVKKSIAAIASRWFLRNAAHRLAGSGSLGALRIHRRTVRSGMSQHLQLPANPRRAPGAVLREQLVEVIV